MAIKVNTKIFNVLKQYFASDIADPETKRDPIFAAWYMRTVKEEETAIWIEQNQAQYKAGVLAGFEIDNSQEAQLKDIHSRKNI